MDIKFPTIEANAKRLLKEIENIEKLILSSNENEEEKENWCKTYFKACYYELTNFNEDCKINEYYNLSRLFTFFHFPEEVSIKLSITFSSFLEKEGKKISLLKQEEDDGIVTFELNYTFFELMNKFFEFFKKRIENEIETKSFKIVSTIYPAPLFNKWSYFEVKDFLNDANKVETYYFNNEDEYHGFDYDMLEGTNCNVFISPLTLLESFAFYFCRILKCEMLNAPQLIREHEYKRFIYKALLLLPFNIVDTHYEDFNTTANALEKRLNLLLEKYKCIYNKVQTNKAVKLILLKDLIDVFDDPFGYKQLIEDEETLEEV